jgi:hypothetical protein
MSTQALYFWATDAGRPGYWQGIHAFPDIKTMQALLVKHGYIVRRGTDGAPPDMKPTPDELKQLARQMQP